LAERNDELQTQLKDQEWVSEKVEEVGISLIMNKDFGYYNLPLQQEKAPNYNMSGGKRRTTHHSRAGSMQSQQMSV
jgi:hypothetical protein